MKPALSAIPIASCLSDVGAGQSAAAPRAPEALRARAASESSENLTAARLAEAHARGMTEGRAAAEAILLDRLENQKRLAIETLSAERKAWVDTESKKFASALEEGLRGVERGLADQIARILGPLLVDLKRDQATAELISALGAILPGSRQVTLEFAGPSDIANAIAQAVDVKTAAVITTVSNDTEFTIRAASTVLETRFKSWAHLIERAVA